MRLFTSRKSSWFPALLLPITTLAVNVTLPYGTFVGVDSYTNDQDIPLANPLVAYLGIPYAAPPTGKLRYSLPQPPLKANGTASATSYGPMCMQAGAGEMDEDCLSLNVFAPNGTKKGSKLPVVIFIHGGAFNSGSGRGFLASMVSNGPGVFIGVSINYRLGALGFLTSNLSYQAGALNLGLYDQVQAIQWVHKYISLFGGDPTKVTLFGQSAGATSVGYHLQHVNQPPLFRGVIMDSGAPTARACPNWTYPLYQTQTDEFLALAGCEKGNSANATFACLRSVLADTLKNASVALFMKYNPVVTWPFQPVIDKKYILQKPHLSWESGTFNKVPILTGFNSDEGSIFVPQNLNTTAQFQQFFKNLAPLISDSQLATVADLYPDPEAPGSPYANSPLSPQFLRVTAAYGDFAYIAQVQATSIYASSKDLSVWKYHFAHTTPGVAAYFGVPHGSELPFVNGKYVATSTGEIAAQSKLMNAYWSSFVVSGNPNAFSANSRLVWPAYKTTNEQQIRFSNGSAYIEPDGIRRNATDFWRSIPDVLMH
ncbi:acetylcholinesterase [Ceratobasidium sp. AG-I]|nr:acetylcholinesterase [Ceratobasidium sp. AG-I]